LEVVYCVSPGFAKKKAGGVSVSQRWLAGVCRAAMEVEGVEDGDGSGLGSATVRMLVDVHVYGCMLLDVPQHVCMYRYEAQEEVGDGVHGGYRSEEQQEGRDIC
jgi:hypothetical protein